MKLAPACAAWQEGWRRAANSVSPGRSTEGQAIAAREKGKGAKERRADPAEALTGWTCRGLDFPTFRLSLVAKAIDRLTLRMLAENGDLSIAQWRVLSRLARTEGATVRQIAEMAWVDRAEVSRAAASLEERGLTGRRANPVDGRAPILFCTVAGLAEYERILPVRAAFHRRFTEDLSGEERKALDGLLARIAAKVGEIADE